MKWIEALSGLMYNNYVGEEDILNLYEDIQKGDLDIISYNI